MSRLRVNAFSVSIDGFGAGPEQSLENPLGVGGFALHDWVFPTRTFQRAVIGKRRGRAGIDDDFAARGFENLGAWILGRNMFGPVRGPWPDESWKGWWGDDPPYHVARLRPHAPPAALRSRWRAARRSTSSRTGSTPRSSGRGRRPAAATSVSAAASPRSGSTSARASSTKCTSRSRPVLLGTGRGAPRRNRPARARLPLLRARRHAERDARRPHESAERVTRELARRRRTAFWLSLASPHPERLTVGEGCLRAGALVFVSPVQSAAP